MLSAGAVLNLQKEYLLLWIGKYLVLEYHTSAFSDVIYRKNTNQYNIDFFSRLITYN